MTFLLVNLALIKQYFKCGYLLELFLENVMMASKPMPSPINNNITANGMAGLYHSRPLWQR